MQRRKREYGTLRAAPRLHERDRPRRGAATLDYILVLGIILPLAAFLMTAGRRMIVLVYEMLCVFVSWPFL